MKKIFLFLGLFLAASQIKINASTTWQLTLNQDQKDFIDDVVIPAVMLFILSIVVNVGISIYKELRFRSLRKRVERLEQTQNALVSRR